MEVKLALGMIIISFILTGVNIMLYFQIEKLIKFLREYKIEKTMSLKADLDRLEQSLAMYALWKCRIKKRKNL